MQEKGHISDRSRAGVKLDQLAEVCGCTPQMVRRYVLGEALPDIDITVRIAQWLDVTPGWLLFGDNRPVLNFIPYTDHIHIEADVLEYILLKTAPLYNLNQEKQDLVSFVMEIIQEVTQLAADKKAMLKLIDVSVSSALRFQQQTVEV